MKRVFALALALLMIMSILAGCGSGAPQETAAPTAAPTEAATEAATDAPAVIAPDQEVSAAADKKGTFGATEPEVDESYIEYVNGTWDTKTTKLGTVSTSMYLLDQNLEGCQEMTVYVLVEMKGGAHCKDWTLWGRVDGSVEKIGEFLLPDGDGETSAAFTFDPAINIDAIAITPKVAGGYSWSQGLGVGEVHLAK